MSAYALTNDYAADRLTSFASVRHRLRAFQDVLSSGGGTNRSRLARTLKYLWAMARTLFDIEDPPEAKRDDWVRRPRRAAIVPVRLTEAERDQLAEVARDLGISLSTYVRQVVLSRPLPPRRAVRPIPEVNRETYHALGRLAADVQAIARVVAERRREPGDRGVLDALELVTRLVGTVRAEVLGTTLGPDGGEP